MLALYFNNKGWVRMNKSKFCSNWGNAIQGDSKFCGGCGQPSADSGDVNKNGIMIAREIQNMIIASTIEA